jgi:hypothetical protein
LISRLFNIDKNDITIKDESKRGVALILQRSNIHYALVNKGLKIGDKTIGQSAVPDFVFNNLPFIKCGLRGLFDTDGSLYVSDDGYLGISFSNRSQNLVCQFSKMFTLLFCYDISKISERIADDGSVTWLVVTQSIQKVKDFLDKIKPERFKEPYKRLWLGLRYIFLNSNSDIIYAVTNKIKQWKSENKKNIFQYRIENAVLLQRWCEEIFISFNIDNVQGLPFSGYISNDMIERALTSALVYSRYT